MPGTLMFDAYHMSVVDALAVLWAAGDSPLFLHDLTPNEADELRRAARAVVEAHAVEVVLGYVRRLNPAPKTSEQGILRVVQGGKTHEPT